MVEPGTTIVARDRFLASIEARRGQAGAVAATIAEGHGIDLPSAGRWAGGADIAFAWSGPGEWTAIADRPIARDLAGRLAGLAAVTDQSDGWLLIEVSGPRVRDTLAKMLPIDLDPAALPPGAVALTRAGHIDVRLRHVSVGVYELAVFRSLGADFAGWLAASAAEFR